MRLACLIAVIGVSLITACGPQPALLRCPAQGASWRAITTPHFELKTNAPRAQALAIAETLEESYQLLEFWLGLWLPVNERAGERIEAIHLAKASELHRFTSATIGGFVAHGDGTLLMVTAGAASRDLPIDELLRHELTHRIMSDALSFLPPWVSEGVAEFFSSVDIDKKRTLAGRLTTRARRHWFADTSALPSLGALRAMRGDELQTPESYFAAWRAVHFFALRSKDLQQAFGLYTRLLAQGVAEEPAWRAAFGERELELDAAISAYGGTQEIAMLAQTTPRLQLEKPQLRPMADSEVHRLMELLWQRAPRSEDSRRIEPKLEHVSRKRHSLASSF